MAEQFLILTIANVLVFLLGISVGRSFILLRLRKEENKKRELELRLLEKRTEAAHHGKQIAHNLEELLYKAQVQQEIDQILRKRDGS
jgi:hypothetical protein